MVLGILKTTAFSVANSYEIITIPMFILMAEFVILSGVADDLFTAASAWVGRLRGGLAMATAIGLRRHLGLQHRGSRDISLDHRTGDAQAGL